MGFKIIDTAIRDVNKILFSLNNNNSYYLYKMYKELVCNNIKGSLISNNNSWHSILKNSLNTDPKYLLTVLKTLTPGCKNIKNNEIMEDSFFSFTDKTTTRGETTPNSQMGDSNTAGSHKIIEYVLHQLPDESPAFYQWWYDRKSYPRLVEFIFSLLKPESLFLFLGAPSLGCIFSELYKKKSTIMDRDDYVMSLLHRISDTQNDYIPYDVNDDPSDFLKDRFHFV